MNSSPTPSEENLRNTFYASTCDALESFVKKEEESYDRFMNAFLYLKKEDVLQWEDKKKTKSVDSSLEKIPKPTVPQQDKEKNVDCLLADEELEQEVLSEGSEGSISSRLEERQVIKTGTQIKFDNYVVDDEEEEEEEEDFKTGHKSLRDLLGNSTGYTASCDHSTDERKRILTRIGDTSDTYNKELASELSLSDKELQEESWLIDSEKEFEIIMDEYSTNPGPKRDTISPGEVENIQGDPTIQDLQNITQLDFVTTYRTEEVQHDVDTEGQTECSNEVMPFTLDEDFDYDHVTLTPKYTFAEMKRREELLHRTYAQTENVIMPDTVSG